MHRCMWSRKQPAADAADTQIKGYDIDNTIKFKAGYKIWQAAAEGATSTTTTNDDGTTTTTYPSRESVSQALMSNWIIYTVVDFAIMLTAGSVSVATATLLF